MSVVIRRIAGLLGENEPYFGEFSFVYGADINIIQQRMLIVVKILYFTLLDVSYAT